MKDKIFKIIYTFCLTIAFIGVTCMFFGIVYDLWGLTDWGVLIVAISMAFLFGITLVAMWMY